MIHTPANDDVFDKEIHYEITFGDRLRDANTFGDRLRDAKPAVLCESNICDVFMTLKDLFNAYPNVLKWKRFWVRRALNEKFVYTDDVCEILQVYMEHVPTALDCECVPGFRDAKYGIKCPFHNPLSESESRTQYDYL